MMFVVPKPNESPTPIIQYSLLRNKFHHTRADFATDYYNFTINFSQYVKR